MELDGDEDGYCVGILNNLWGLGTLNWQAGGIDSFESIPGLLKCLAYEMEVTDGRC